jgi:hypothetical protein
MDYEDNKDGTSILHQTLTIRNSFTERPTEQGVTKVFFLFEYIKENNVGGAIGEEILK